MNPGTMQVLVMPYLPKLVASVRVSCTTAPFAQVYMKLSRPPRSPNPDDTLMILPPPRSTMWRETAREQ